MFQEAIAIAMHHRGNGCKISYQCLFRTTYWLMFFCEGISDIGNASRSTYITEKH